jgi:hypothetical protein
MGFSINLWASGFERQASGSRLRASGFGIKVSGGYPISRVFCEKWGFSPHLARPVWVGHSCPTPLTFVRLPLSSLSPRDQGSYQDTASAVSLAAPQTNCHSERSRIARCERPCEVEEPAVCRRLGELPRRERIAAARSDGERPVCPRIPGIDAMAGDNFFDCSPA